MKKLLFLTPINYMIPAVKGGAFASRIEDLIKINEIEKYYDITVVSQSDREAIIKASAYPDTKFFFIETDEKAEKRQANSKLVRIVNRVSFHVCGRMLIVPPRLKKALKEVWRYDFDYIFVGGGEPEEFAGFTRRYGKDKMYFNVGGQLKGGRIVTSTFGHFICCSKYIENYMKQDTYSQKTDIRHILDRCDLSLFSQKLDNGDREDIVEKYGLSGKTTFVYMGRISEEKGVRELLEAFSEFEYRQNSALLIIGSVNFGAEGTSDFEKEIQDRVGELPEAKMTGYIHHDNLWKVLKCCDVAVLPSIWEEPSGNVVPESMAAGLPTIICRSGGMVEYVDSSTSIIVEKDNVVANLRVAMKKMYEEPEIRCEMSQAALKKAKQYDTAIYYRKLISLFENNCDVEEKMEKYE